jgi:hypothetical protein
VSALDADGHFVYVCLSVCLPVCLSRSSLYL